MMRSQYANSQGNARKLGLPYETIAHIGYTGSDDDRDRCLAAHIWLSRNDNDYLQMCAQAFRLTTIRQDCIDLNGNPPRDFLTEHRQYDLVIFHNLWSPLYGYPDSGGARTSSMHNPETWRKRLLNTKARYIFIFGADFNAPDLENHIPGYRCIYVGFETMFSVFIHDNVSWRGALHQFISHADLTQARLNTLTDFKNSRYLDISNTTLTEKHMKTIATMSSLEELRAAGAIFQNANFRYLSVLNSLRRLDLSRTEVTDEKIISITCLSKLEQLSLNRTQISDDTLASLAHLTELKWLSIVGSRATRAGVRQIQLKLPDCEVSY